MHCCGLTFVFILHAVLADCGGNLGTRYADGVCVLRAWQYWLARYQTPHHRLQPALMPCFMYWIGCRFVLRVCICLDRSWGESVTGLVCFAGYFHTSQYQVLTRLAQFSLARNRMSIRWRRRRQRFPWRRKPVRGRGGNCATDDLRGVGVKILPSPCTGEGVERLMRFYGFAVFSLNR